MSFNISKNTFSNRTLLVAASVMWFPECWFNRLITPSEFYQQTTSIIQRNMAANLIIFTKKICNKITIHNYVQAIHIKIKTPLSKSIHWLEQITKCQNLWSRCTTAFSQTPTLSCFCQKVNAYTFSSIQSRHRFKWFLNSLSETANMSP